MEIRHEVTSSLQVLENEKEKKQQVQEGWTVNDFSSI